MTFTRRIYERLSHDLRIRVSGLVTALRALRQETRGARQLVRSMVSDVARSSTVRGLPVHLTIEPTAVCDMGCPVCETGAGQLERVKGFMRFDPFRRVVDEMAPHVNTLFLYHMGEPFLNKEVYRMIAYAREKGLFVSTCTNGHFVDAKRLIASGINEISFQIGGITQETHEVYRVRGNLERSLANLRACIDERRRLPGSTTRLALGFIVMKHNEHELDGFARIAREIGVDDSVVLQPCVRTYEQGLRYLPKSDAHWYYDRRAFEERRVLRPKVIPDNHCNWIYYSTLIQWDGNVVPCCRDATGKHVMGNVFEEPFERIWNGPRYRAFRERIQRAQGGIDICKLCSGYGIPALPRTNAERRLPLVEEGPSVIAEVRARAQSQARGTSVGAELPVG